MRPCFICGRTKIDHAETPCISKRFYTPMGQPIKDTGTDWLLMFVILGVILSLMGLFYYCLGGKL